MWTKEIIKLLIKEYKRHDLLYDSTHKHYANREKRQECFENICKTLKKFNREITVELVKRKITTLRSQFTQANKMKPDPIEDDSDEDETSQPALWCYDELSFLSDYKPKATESDSLKKVWAELDQMQRQFRKEIDNPKASMASTEATKRSNSTLPQSFQKKFKKSLPSSYDVVKNHVAVKQEVSQEAPILKRSSSVFVAAPAIKYNSKKKTQTKSPNAIEPASKSYSERKIEMNSPSATISANKSYIEQKTKTNPSQVAASTAKSYSELSIEINPSSIEKCNVIPLLQQQLQMQTQQLQMITSMLKSIESLSQQQMKVTELKTAAIERLTEATERQTASLGNLMIEYQEGECDKEDLTDIIYMD